MTTVDWSVVPSANRCRVRYERIKPLLDMQGEFRAADVPDSVRRSDLRWLANQGALRIVRRDRTSGKRLSVYRWDPVVKRELERYGSQLATLPCGCRAHIPPGDGDTPEGRMACKHCGAVHPRATFRAALDGDRDG
jgi:hypothetical protein